MRWRDRKRTISRGRTVWKPEGDFEQPALPRCLLLAGHAAFPGLEIKATEFVLQGFGVKAEGVVFAPLFASYVLVVVL